MDKKQEYNTIDLHHHSKYSYEVPKATLSVKEILEYYRLLSEIKPERVVENGKVKFVDKKVAFSICDHNSAEGAWHAWKQINKHPERYKNIDFIPGIEFGVDCSRVLTYQDKVNNDTKYVFKGMHLLTHAKPGKEEEFFKRTWTISMLNKMVIKPEYIIQEDNHIIDQNKCFYNKEIIANSNEEKSKTYISIGGQILAARTLIFKKYGIKVPYDCYKPCIKNGASYQEIRDIFLEETYKYIASHSQLFKNRTKEGAKIEMSKTISYITRLNNVKAYIFPYKPMIIGDLHNLNKIDILEIPKLLGDTATTCFAHPYTLKIHKETAIPVKALQNVDLSMLPTEVKTFIENKLADPEQVKNGFLMPNDILQADGKRGSKFIQDKVSLVSFQILNNILLKKGVRIDGYEVTKRHGRTGKLDDTLDIIMDKYNMTVSFGSDDHFNNMDTYYYKDISEQCPDPKKESYYGYHKMLATESSYFKLNRSGKDKLDAEENSVTIKFC